MGPLRRFLARVVLGTSNNTVTLDDPYQTMGKLLPAKDVHGIIDVGASYGRVASRLLRQFPTAKAWLFEPHPDYVDVLNQAHRQDPRLCPQFLAVGDHDGTATLNITASPGTTSLLNPNQALTASYATESRVIARHEVPVVTLDNWRITVPDRPIELIKLDIQGGELAALRGARGLLTSTVRLVYTEIMFNSLYEGGAVFADLDSELRACGFLLHDIFKPKYDDAGMLTWGNAIYLKK